MFNEYEKPSVHFHLQKASFRLDERGKLKRFIALLINKENKALGSLNFIFCSDRSLLKINQHYLNHDFYTDIISFDLSEIPEIITGEIYISVDRVQENAKTYKTSFEKELHRVIFHGVLHLCGYKDKTNRESQLMRKKENLYLDFYKGFT